MLAATPRIESTGDARQLAQRRQRLRPVQGERQRASVKAPKRMRAAPTASGV